MVSLYAQMLTRQHATALDERAVEFLRFIRDGSDRMQALVDDLLAFTQAGDTNDEAPRRVDLNLMLETVVSNLKVAIDESGAQVRWHNLPIIMADERAVSQIFQNLVSNAVKYRRPTEPPKIVISAESRSGEWLFRVADNGIGIDPRYHQQVFGIFKRLHQNEYPGTGIGLAICQRVVERHGGTIWLESMEGAGATFLFTWPKPIS
jgi:light-regulated signal transduction histidine kinase (bacteriophytochrome)